MRKLAVIGACVAGAVAGGALMAPIAAAQAAVAPSVVQLCAATDIPAVDALLVSTASTDLVGALAPLAALTVPRTPSGVTVRAAVTLGQVRTALGCSTVTVTPTPTPTVTPTPTATPVPTPVPTTSPRPTTTPAPDSDFDQVQDVPSKAAETGGGPA